MKGQHLRRSNKNDKKSNDVRSEGDRDEARLIHSAAFRRLQAKTQVLGLGESDFYRTRLTHSMEVAQIGRGIVQYLSKSGKAEFEKYQDLLPDMSLITAICLAHDIGHPPFGHGGEVALNYCMKNYGGFEGNAQTLRIVGKIEKYDESYGIDPTRRMLLGVLKYPASYSNLVNQNAYAKNEVNKPDWLFQANKQKPPKCYYDIDQDIVDFIFEAFDKDDVSKFKCSSQTSDAHGKTKYKSFDCSIMDLADNISYSLHDFEDTISLGLITKDVWQNHFKGKESLFNDHAESGLCLSFTEITQKLFSDGSCARKKAIGSLVHLMISNVQVIDNGSKCQEPLLKYKVVLESSIEELRTEIFNLVVKKAIKNVNVQQLEFKGQKVIVELFNVLKEDPERFLPESTKKKWLEGCTDNEKMRVICDFIAGMTDTYATKFYERFTTPNRGSIFEKL